MDPLRIYEYLTLVRDRMFEAIRPLGDDAYRREFPIGLGALDTTLTHIMISEWYYVQRLGKREIPPYEQWPIRTENPPPCADLERAWTEQAASTRAALGTVHDWSEAIEYRVTDDEKREILVATTPSDLFTQLALHEVHHRAQALNMLRQLGVEFSEDLDFNALMMTRRHASSETGE